MKKLKKVLKYTVLGMAFSFLLFVIVSNVISHCYGFHKIDAFSQKANYPINYFKDSALKEITIESLYKNGFNDSVYILNYTDSFTIVFWIIKQNSRTSFINNIDTFQERLVPEYYVPYVRLFLSSLTIKRKAFNLDLSNISIHFGDCKNLSPLINNNTCKYYHVKAGTIYLTSNANSHYDLFVSLNNSTYSDFMASIKDDKLFLFAMYSTKGSNISPEALSSIVNFPVMK